MEHKIVILCPYFGKINPSLHSLWLQGCAANADIDFLIISDDADAINTPLPPNVRGEYMPWEDCIARCKSKFDFEITIANPYKLCDFKPAYGSLFSDLIGGYDFWGHLDCSDTILGNIRKFITDDILEVYDKIHSFGHFTLYRNTPENNSRFLISPSCGITIRELFSRPEVTGFDEMNHPWSINTIYKENSFTLLERIPNLVADIFPSKWAFQIVEDQGEIIPRIFEWDHGELFDVTVRDMQINKREIGYVHLQKRKMANEVPTETDHFYIVPNRFLPADDSLTCEMIEQWSKDRIYLDPLKGRIKRVVNYAKQPEVFLRKLKEKLS